MSKSSIEWTGETWNPTTGCTKVSAGCRACYAEIMHRRLRAMGQTKYSEPFTSIRTHADELKRPFTWAKPRTIFVNSMSDLMHEDIPEEFIQEVFGVMNLTEQHTYQVLTKRSSRLLGISDALTWTDNIWMGVSVEDYRVLHRIDHLRHSGAKVKFLSLEPLLGPLPNLNLEGIDWVIVGGESGRKPRKMNPEWVEDIRKQCESADVAFFFKQTGSALAKEWGLKNAKGGDISEWPTLLQVRQMPSQLIPA